MSSLIIYGLVDPVTGLLRYVGKSSSGLRRPRQHAQPGQFKRDSGHKANWIRKLHREGLSYLIVEIQHVADRDVLSQAEIFWIAYFKGLGCDLLNATAGGDGGFTGYSAERNRKLSLALKGRKRTDAERAAISRGKQFISAETRAKLSAAGRGRKHSEAQRRKNSEAKTGTKASSETKAKMSAARAGYRHSEETKAKISASHKARFT